MKKILALVLALTTVLALAVPAMAADTVIEEAGFHCNGNVSPVIPNAYKTTDENGKVVYVYPINRVGNTTAWALDDSQGKIVCPACERTDWVSYSNNSGVPNGKNIQFEHPSVTPEPEQIEITVKVIYRLDVPTCTAKCRFTKLKKCNFSCDGCKCPYEVNFRSHNCTLDCAKERHATDCPVNNFTPCNPNKDCKCERTYSEEIYEEKILIPIGGSCLFEYSKVHKTWKGGVYVSGGRPISATVTKDTTFIVHYKGCGKCKCTCEKPVCNIKCEPCTFKPICNHVGIICDNCKNGKGNNHSNCEFGNPNTTSNYFCLKCAKKVGALKWDKKTDKYSWEPADKGENAWSPTSLLPICECGCDKL